MIELFEKTLKEIHERGKWPSNSEWLKILTLADSETKRWYEKFVNETAQHSDLRVRIAAELGRPMKSGPA